MRVVGPARICLVLAVGLGHGVALYALLHVHRRIGMDGPPMIRPAIAKNPVREPIRAIESRPWQPSKAEVLPYPDRVWHFPRVDIWPMTGEPCPTPSEFGPIMDTQPVAEDVQAPAERAPAKSISELKTGTPRMVLWLRPAYPMQWALTEMEGSTRLAFKIRTTGNTDEIEVERSSGSQKLDLAAAQAAKAWRFAPGRWQGRSIESKATIELTFNFFEYRVSAIDEETISRASRRDVAKIGHLDRSARIRTLVEALRSGSVDELVAPAYANAPPSWPATMRDWGPISGIQYLGPIGAPEWRRYSVNLKHPAKHAKTVLMRWELYRVAHTDHAALWEVAIDRTSRVWGVEAEPLEDKERANNSQAACPDDARSSPLQNGSGAKSGSTHDFRAVTENSSDLVQYLNTQSDRPIGVASISPRTTCKGASGRSRSDACAARKEARVIVS
jgi:TonB family protein